MKRAAAPVLEAMLLLGPTGAGKTPLGAWLEAQGMLGRPCHHFDFGAGLRTVADGRGSGPFTPAEIRFIQRVLTEGVLLEDESFCLAVRILDAFIAVRGIQPAHWLVLNGLPRHLGQAQAMPARIQVRAIIQLECDAPIIRERLARDPGGDRASRTDDHADLVARKLAIYQERTRPLVAYYEERGARRVSIPIGASTRPDEVAHQMAAALR